MNWASSSVPRFRKFSRAGTDKPLMPKGMVDEKILADGVACEWIKPVNETPSPVLLYFHGGGWVLGLYNNHRWMVANLAQAAGVRALVVDYRLAPEHPFPAAVDDCVTAYRWLLKSGVSAQQIVFAGDSAGGNLVLATAVAARDAGDPLPAGLVCLSPMTDLAYTGDSYYKVKDTMMSPPFTSRLASHYAGDTPRTNPLLSPHYADLHGLPPLLIHVGEDELLNSDSTRLAENARKAGIDVQLKIWPRMWHVFQMFVPYMPEASEAVAEIAAFVKMRTKNK